MLSAIGPGAEPIAGYRLIEPLGRGGFGEVWKASAPGGFLKAVKIVFGDLSTNKGNSAAKELKSLERVRNVRHPFVLSTERYDVVDGRLCIVTELADQNLEDRFQECLDEGLEGIPRPELLRYLSEASEALDLMNADYDLQHLDVKPQNIFLVGKHVKVADFGLVADLEGFSAKLSGGVTPIYAAPETFEGWVSRYTDQYSLAIVFQEMLTGRRPFPGPSPRQYLLQHLQSEPDLSPLPEADREIVARALSKHPSDRFDTVTSFVRALIEASPDHADADRSESHVPVPAPAAVASPEPETALMTGHAHTPCDVGQTTVRCNLPTSERVPAIIVGLGSVGVQCLARLQERLDAQKSDPAEPSDAMPVRMIGIDTDKRTLGRLQRTESESMQDLCNRVVVCGHHDARYYRDNWGQLGHLSRWLDLQDIFDSARLNSPAGSRPLARLAFVEHYRRICNAIRMEVVDMRRRFGLDQGMRVYVVASMGGNAGSGMLLDTGYLLRKLLQEAGYERPGVHAHLAAGFLDDRDVVRRKINHYALALELQEYSKPGARFVAEYEPGFEETYSGPAFTTTTALDVNSDRLCEPKATSAINSIAESILVSMQAPRHLPNQSLMRDSGTFRSVGTTVLAFPEMVFLRKTASRLCYTLVAKWAGKMDNAEGRGGHPTTTSCLATEGSDPRTVTDQITDQVESMVSGLVDVYVTDPLMQLKQELASGNADESEQCVNDLISRLRELTKLSDGRASEGDDLAVLDYTVSLAGKAVAELLAENVVDTMRQIIDEPGNKLANVLQMREGYLGYFERLAEQQLNQVVRHDHRAQVDELAKELRRAGQGHKKHDEAEAVVEFLASRVESVVRDIIHCRLEREVAEVYQVVCGKVSDYASESTVLRQNLERLLDLFRDEWNADVRFDLIASRVVFPGATGKFDDAVRDYCKQCEGCGLDHLEAELRHVLVNQHGSSISALAGRTTVTQELVDQLLGACIRWAREQCPISLRDCLWDRFGEHCEDRDALLCDLYESSRPTMTARLQSDGSWSQGASKEELLLGVPKGRDFEWFADAFKQANPEVRITRIHTDQQCVFHRVWKQNLLTNVLPEWLPRARDLFMRAGSSAMIHLTREHAGR